MGLVARLLGRKRGSEEGEPRVSRLQASTRERTRREVIAMAVRDTLRRHGLPAGCIVSDVQPGLTRAGHRGVHIQLVFRAAEPGLLAYAVALEFAVQARLQRLDPLSPAWIAGLSWRLEPEDPTTWPNLPTVARAGASAPRANTGDPGQPALGLEKLFQSRDEAYVRARGGAVVPANAFSPTLPMQVSS